jgi:hypothetical protein
MKGTGLPETSEESKVGFVLVLSFLIALIGFVVLLYLNLAPLFILHDLFGGVGFYSGFIITIFSLHIIFSFILAWRFHFSHRQFKMLARSMLCFNVGLPLALIAYGYLLLGPMVPIVRELRGAGILLMASMNVALFGLIVVLKKLFGRRIYGWVRIKYVPENASSEVAEKHIGEAKARLEKGFPKRASQDFHAAAVMFLRLEDWSKTAENYWMAAETLSKEPDSDLGFGISWLYALSASAHILSGNIEEAEKALALGKRILKNRKTDRNKEEKVSLILEFLAAILNRNNQQADATWQKLSRRITKWGYPTTEETIVLLKRNYDALKVTNLRVNHISHTS